MSINADSLEERGIAISPNSRYREVNKYLFDRFGYSPIGDDEREFLIDYLIDADEYSRLAFSYDALISSRNRAVSKTLLYPNLTEKLTLLGHQFADHQIEIILGIESFLTFPSTLFPEPSLSEFLLLSSENYLNLSWIDVYERIIATLPNAKVSIFQSELSALNWPRIVGGLLGFQDVFHLKGIYAYPIDVVSTDERRPFFRSLKRNKPTTLSEYQTIVNKFLPRKSLLENAMVKYPASNWNAEVQSDLVENYMDDVEQFLSMPNVEVL